MINQEMINRMNEAAKNVDPIAAQLAHDAVRDNSIADYWANSASQSYVNAVKSGNVRQA